MNEISSKVDLQTKNGVIQVASTDQFAWGMEADYSGNQITVQGLTMLKVTGGKYAGGIGSYDGGLVTVSAQGAEVIAKAPGADGVASAIYGLDKDAQTMVSGIESVTAIGVKWAEGIDGRDGGYVKVSDVKNIKVESNTEATGICAVNGGHAEVSGAQTTLNVKSAAIAYGILSTETNTQLQKNSAVTVTGLKDIKVKGGTFAIGVQATDRGTALVELNGDMDIAADQSARAIVAGSFSASNKYKDDYPSTTTVIGVGTNPSTISAKGGTYSALLYLDNGGTINVENIIGSEDLDNTTAFAVAAAEEGGIVNMTKTNLAGNVNFDAADSIPGVTNELNINIDKDSFLVGGAKVINDDGSKNAAININNQGIWGITDNSTLGTLTNNGKVTFVDTKSTPLVLKADTLAGSGFYCINTDLANQSGDTIVAGTSNNAHIKIQVISDPVYDSQDWNSVAQRGYQVLSISSGSTNVEGAPLDIGAYRVTPNVISNGTTSWNISGFNVGPSENTMTAADARAVINEAWLMDTNSLSKRLGDLRVGDTGDDGVWARFQRSNNKVKGDRQAKLNANLFQVGYDKSFKRKDGKMYVGIAVDHIDGTGSYENGGGDVKVTSVALYNTWMGDKGHYYDIVLRQGHYSNDYSLTDLSGAISISLFQLL